MASTASLRSLHLAASILLVQAGSVPNKADSSETGEPGALANSGMAAAKTSIDLVSSATIDSIFMRLVHYGSGAAIGIR